jgi:aspartate carbamoyltransferase catalytic subunit
MKGETLEDTIRVVGNYVDVIVLRHHESGAAERAARMSSVPIVNAGDGAGQHPTQALLDLFTIQDELGALDGKTVALVGDLLYGRTVWSLSYLFAKNYALKKLFLVAPEPVRMKDDILEFLRKKKVNFEETGGFESNPPLLRCRVSNAHPKGTLRRPQ